MKTLEEQIQEAEYWQRYHTKELIKLKKEKAVQEFRRMIDSPKPAPFWKLLKWKLKMMIR